MARGGLRNADRAGKLIGNRNTPNRRPRQHLVAAIYDGTASIGDVFEEGPSRFAAVNPDGRLIGVYPDLRAAEAAIFAARRAGR